MCIRDRLSFTPKCQTATTHVVAVWHFGVKLSGVSPILVPAPLDVGKALLREGYDLLSACGMTALAALCGLTASTLLGVFAACLFSQSKLIRNAFYPYAILLQTMPVIAVAPIVVIAFGRGFFGVAVIAMILSSFPIVTSTTTGLMQVDASLKELFQFHQATRWQTLWKLRLPYAVPYFINGLRIAAGASIVGAIVGEFFVGSGAKGLGVLIQNKRNMMNVDELYATVLVSTLLGVSAFAAITLAGDLILRRFLGRRLAE